MFRSRAVAKVNHSKSCNTMLIFGIGKGFLTNLLLISKKLLRKRTVLFFFGVINKGQYHSDAGYHSNTPSLTSLSTSLIRVSLCIFGTGKAWQWYRDTPSFSWKEAGFVFLPPKVPSKAAQISREAAVTSFDDWHLGACNCPWKLTGDLLYYIWHLESALHVR